MRASRAMARAAVLLLALGATGAARGDLGADEQRFDNGAYPVEFRLRVNAAADRAAHAILARQRPDGGWDDRQNGSYPIGPSALATLALLKGGVPADHPRIEKAFAYLRSLPLDRTYAVAILLLALDAKHGTAEDGFAVESVDRYGQRTVPTPCAEKISKADLEWMNEAVKYLLDAQGVGGTGTPGAPGAWRYPGRGHDLSNTQYALLGLKAAARCGVKVPVDAWVDSLRYHLDAQEQDGPEVKWRANEVRGDYRVEWTETGKARGFRYTAQSERATGAMTTAGLASLLICQSELWKSRRFTGELRDRTRVAIRDALAWMQTNFRVNENPGAGSSWHHYYLYGLERAGILGHFRFVGEHDWYELGATHLLATQSPDGTWQGGNLVDTCFALLFLKRASFRTANPAITPTK